MKERKWVFLPLIFSVMLSFYRGELWGVFVKRGLVVLTLGSVLWSFYNLLKEPVIVVKMIITGILIGVISLLLVILTLSKTGW
jgi:uncharacterized membrane protein